MCSSIDYLNDFLFLMLVACHCACVFAFEFVSSMTAAQFTCILRCLEVRFCCFDRCSGFLREFDWFTVQFSISHESQFPNPYLSHSSHFLGHTEKFRSTPIIYLPASQFSEGRWDCDSEELRRAMVKYNLRSSGHDQTISVTFSNPRSTRHLSKLVTCLLTLPSADSV